MFFGTNFRRQIFQFVIVGFSTLLVLQLFRMQIVENKSFVDKANRNSIKKIVQQAPRGIFYDRNFNILVSNRPSFILDITPDKYDTKNTGIIEEVIGVDSGYIAKVLRKKRFYSRFLPRKIKSNLSFQSITWLDEQSRFLPGVSYVIDLQRDYSFGINGSHFFGYIKEISPKFYKKNKPMYSIDDNIGVKGLEKTYEKYLRGVKGYDYIIVDSKRKTIGKYLNGKADRKPIKGDDLVLSIDKQTQIVARNELKNRKGAIVALDPTTGEIIAFVSSPQYDLSLFSNILSNEKWKQLVNNPNKPLFNRATMSIYPPGSTIKMIAAIAALEEGTINKNWTIFCKGGYQLGNRFFGCDHYHGKTNLTKAIEASCNTYFYQLMLKLGLEKWHKYAGLFGLGNKTGIDIPEENSGLLPDKNYLDKRYGKNKWSRGLLLNLVIGQGEVGVTPLQLAHYTALLANNGVTKKPHFVKGYVDKFTQRFVPFSYDDEKINISEKTLKTVKNAMFLVVNGKEGTARNISNSQYKIAGKTGTSQNPFGKNHAVFIAYAPADNPKIAVAVVVENVGYGSTYAAPIARKVIDAYLRVKPSFMNTTKSIMLQTKKEAKTNADKL